MDYKDVWLNFEGRISRSEFWLKGFLPIVVINLLISAIDSVITGGLIAALAGIVLIYPSVAIGVKRFHDRNKSGWWVLITLIPVIGWIWYLVECGILQGSAGNNDYGPDPEQANLEN